MKFVTLSLALLILSGCTSYGVVNNKPRSGLDDRPAYSIKNVGDKRGAKEVGLLLAFSGGGTRAAALAYGVMQELRDTTISINGQSSRLLDEVDAISSVSGGSFTSAYYGLYGDRLFEDFEQVFLRQDVKQQLIRRLLSPQRWFSTISRTETAVDFYDESIFRGATFADLQRKGGPLIIINASDLGHGVRFSFLQEYFNLLCSDISTFPVARAVAASSAVPVLFHPIVVENYQNCENRELDWLLAAERNVANDPQLAQVVRGLKTFYNKDKRRYVHLVDGGITDNLGLRAVYEIVEIAGGATEFMKKIDDEPARRFVVISVNASTKPEPKMDLSAQRPSVEETVGAMTDVQLHLYNAATLELMQASMQRWTQELSEPGRPVEPYFIETNFRDVVQAKKRRFFNRIPTSFSLTDEQVDELIAAGRELLRNNPDYRRLIADLGGTLSPQKIQ